MLSIIRGDYGVEIYTISPHKALEFTDALVRYAGHLYNIGQDAKLTILGHDCQCDPQSVRHRIATKLQRYQHNAEVNWTSTIDAILRIMDVAWDRNYYALEVLGKNNINDGPVQILRHAQAELKSALKGTFDLGEPDNEALGKMHNGYLTRAVVRMKSKFFAYPLENGQRRVLISEFIKYSLEDLKRVLNIIDMVI